MLQYCLVHNQGWFAIRSTAKVRELNKDQYNQLLSLILGLPMKVNEISAGICALRRPEQALGSH